jgi:hypothetical protein
MALGVIAVAVWAQQRPAPQLPRREDPEARQLLDHTIQALGGQAFLNAKSLTCRGRMFFFVDGRTAGMEPFVGQYVYPDKRRLVIAKNKKNISMDTGNVTYEGETKPITLINNGDKGWELDQMGLISQTDQQVQGWILANRYSLENLLRLRINDPGVLIQMGQVDFVDNTATQASKSSPRAGPLSGWICTGKPISPHESPTASGTSRKMPGMSIRTPTRTTRRLTAS